MSQSLGDGGIWGKNDRFRGHHSARGVVPVGQESAHIIGFFRIHELKQSFLVFFRQFAEQVSGIVWIHFLKNVSGSFAFQGLKDFDLVVIGKFLEDVSQLLVIKCGGNFSATLGGQFVQYTGEVGWTQLVKGREQMGCALAFFVQREATNEVPINNQSFTASTNPASALADVHLADQPIAGARCFDGNVEDGDLSLVSDQVHLAIQKLAQDQCL